MKIAYIEKRFNRGTTAIIELANTIVERYAADGFRLTLRQIYYQFIARDLFPDDWIDPEYNLKHRLDSKTKNTIKNYKRLGSILSEGRLAGLIDWEAIEDRTRELMTISHWETPNEIVTACGNQFKVDKWSDQQYRVEVWIEKQALAGVVERVCNELDIPYLSCKGYTSQSEMWGAAMRLKSIEQGGQTPMILHLGDHDPSGIDMTRDIQDRLATFGVEPDFKRIALSMAQVRTYICPPNPAKETDCRFKEYEKIYGDESWELDALEPKVMEELIRKEVLEVRDEDLWNARVGYQATCREEIHFVGNNWDRCMKLRKADAKRKKRK